MTKRHDDIWYYFYYNSIEEDLKKTNQYVTHITQNKDTFSDEFTKIIILACNEIDSMLKDICKMKNIPCRTGKKYYDMVDYAKALTLVPEIKSLSLCNNQCWEITPFSDFNEQKPYAGLRWWQSYTMLKHQRIDNLRHGNLFNAMNSVAAQLFIKEYYSCCKYQSDVKKKLSQIHTDYWIPWV